jgi:hypothetical protein
VVTARKERDRKKAVYLNIIKSLKHGKFLCCTYDSYQGWRVSKAFEWQILNFTLKKAPSTAVLRSVYVDWKIFKKM